MSNPVIVVVGAGPGVSGSVARMFARDGYDVGLLGSDPGPLKEVGEALREHGTAVEWAVVDVTDGEAATAGSTCCTSTPVRSGRRTRCT